MVLAQHTKLEQNSQQLVADIFMGIYMSECYGILNMTELKFVTGVPIVNKSELVQLTPDKLSSCEFPTTNIMFFNNK